MYRSIVFVLILTAGSALLTGPAIAQDNEVDPSYTWDLTELYPTVDAWNQARRNVMEEFEKIEARKGTLGDSADSLYQTMSLISETYREAGRVYVYATLNRDEDLRVTEPQERGQLSDVMFGRFTEATAWMQPEILRVGDEKIRQFIEDDERLTPFAFELDNSLRNAPYTLGDEAEQALAYFTQPFSSSENIYSLLSNSDIPFPTITLSDGEEHRIDSQGYSRWRASQDREDRKKVFDAYWEKWLEYRNSIGMVLNSHIQTQVALAKARGYDSVLDRELFQDNLPPEVYHTLVAEVNDALPTLHRYFKLRGRMLGVDQMQYYDIYPTLVTLDREFDIETTKEITLDAMSILGDDWVRMQRDAIDQRWMHVYPQQGKRSGAYMAGSAYDVHPYLLLNYNDDYDSLSTFAHEWGHAMHTLYAKQDQPFETADYATFIAEIPSTSLELILQEHMVQNADSIDEKLFYLGSGLENLRGTFYRQTMFAEFELALLRGGGTGRSAIGREDFRDLRWHREAVSRT